MNTNGEFDIELYYRFTRLDKGHTVIIKRDVDPPKMIGVGGRWNVVNRPRRKSFTTWDGSDLYTMDVPILFDGWDTSKSVEADIAFVNQMRISDDFTPPPKVLVEGAVPVKGAEWVITGIDWGDEIWHEDGYRLRQSAVVHLLEFAEPDQLSIKPPATSHIHTVKPGETLKSISRDEYGTPKYWSAIQKANNIRDIKKLPKTLRIPQIISPG